MINFSKDQWQTIIQGYKGKTDLDNKMKKNMDAYVGDVKTYLPKYSDREEEDDYNNRKDRAEDNYFNFPEKIVSIYRNAIFRSTEPVRSSENEEVKRFWDNTDGAGMEIGKFIKEQVFVLNQVEGGSLVVVDKPPRIKPEGNTITRAEQRAANWFAYAYVYSWRKLRYYSLDRYKQLEYIVFDNGQQDDRRLFKIWDKADWWVVDDEQFLIDEGSHNLGVVPVYRSFAKRNPKFDFELPLPPLQEVTKIAYKLMELRSQFDQMIIGHVFQKIAMPESMYSKIKSSGAGVFNVLIYPDQYEGQQAHYVEMPATEMDSMVSLIFDKYPSMILEFASIRAKTDKPREESGIAKTVDSKDELDNLIDKAENMEDTELAMTKLDMAWEGESDPEMTISYSKNFDVKTVHEQLGQMVEIFKQDLHAPTFAKEIVKRVAKKMLGNVAASDWEKIEMEINEGIDPALSLEDINTLINMGALQILKVAKRYSPELKNKSDEEIAAWVKENMNLVRGAPVLPTDQNLE